MTIADLCSIIICMVHAEIEPASFAYVLQAEALADSRLTAVEQLAACGRDWVVLDEAYDGEEVWTREDLGAIRRGHPGRKVLAYLSIGEAEDYRGYWRKEWAVRGRLTADAPSWLMAKNPDWAGNYRVKYWRKGWQDLVLRRVEQILQQGFDGLYLDIVDAFETFEQVGRNYLDHTVNPETGQTYRRDMVEWVKRIAAHARAIKPDALIIPQNGSQLLEFADFRESINAIGVEDLFTEGNKLQSSSHVREVLEYLDRMGAARKPVLLIEYPTTAKYEAMVKIEARKHGMIWLVTDRELRTFGVSGR